MLAQACVRIQSPGENAGFAILDDEDACRVFVFKKLQPLLRARWAMRVSCGDASRRAESPILARPSCGPGKVMPFVARVISIGLSRGLRRIRRRAEILRPNFDASEYGTGVEKSSNRAELDRRNSLRMGALETNALARPDESRKMRTRPTVFPDKSTRNLLLSEEIFRCHVSRCRCPQADFR